MVIILSVFSALWAIFLAFMILAPNKWASIVDKENNFWSTKGIITPEFATKCARFEKGKLFKIILGIELIAFLILLALFHYIKEPNQALQPTVKTPVELSNVQGTAAEL
jgi:hypothetical protein